MNSPSKVAVKAPDEKRRDANYYSEETQSVDLRMAFCHEIDKDTYQKLFYPVLCRDYFMDVIHSEHHKISMKMYGFVYDPIHDRIDRHSTILSVESIKHEVIDNLRRNIELILHPVELANGFEPSVVLDTDYPNCVIVKGDKVWLECSLAVAIYTLLIRISGIKFSKPEQWLTELSNMANKDKKFITYIGKERIEDVLGNLREMLKLTTIKSTDTVDSRRARALGIHIEPKILIIHQLGKLWLMRFWLPK
jgi:hypothetical protein